MTDYKTFELTQAQAELILEAVEYTLEMEHSFGADDEEFIAEQLDLAYKAMVIQLKT